MPKSLESMRLDLFSYVLNNPTISFAGIKLEFDVEALGYKDKSQILRDAIVYDALLNFEDKFYRFLEEQDYDKRAEMIEELAVAIWLRIHGGKVFEEEKSELSRAVFGSTLSFDINKNDVKKVSRILSEYIPNHPPEKT